MSIHKQNNRCYQKVYEDLYEITRRRKLKLEELALAIYLRGKYCRFGNHFYQSDTATCYELNITPKILRKVRSELQIKGLIKFDAGQGRGKATVYTVLDQLIAQPDPVKGAHLGRKGSQTGTFSLKIPCVKAAQMGTPNNTNKEKNRISVFQGMTETDKRTLENLGVL